jgi:hypothetical protein
MNNIPILPPIIRIELQHLKQTMLMAVADYGDQLSESVGIALDQAIQNFDFVGYVTQISNEIMKEEIKSYFTYGEGRKMIDEVLKEALGKSLSGFRNE